MLGVQVFPDAAWRWRGHESARCRFALVRQGLLRHDPPNSSLKRTVQSLRDWSCRLAQALGRWCSRQFFLGRGPVFVQCAPPALCVHRSASTVCCGKCPDPSRRRRLGRPGLRTARGVVAHRVTGIASGREVWWGCLAKFAVGLCGQGSLGRIGLTIRSSGQSNRCAIGAAA